MKKILFFLLTVSFLSCENSISTKNEDKIFDPQDLSKLDIENYYSFWEGEEINNISDYITANFNSHPNFLKAMRYSSINKTIGVSVFKNRSDAISAMEERINTVACVILNGDSTLFNNNKWWMTDCIPNVIFLNKYNTIIETSYYHDNFEEVKDFLIQSISELSNRIDRLSQ